MKRDVRVKEKVLAALKGGRPTVKAIAALLGKRGSTVYQTLRVLEERGEVQRRPGSGGGNNPPQLWFIPEASMQEVRRRSGALREEVEYEGLLEIERGIPIPPKWRAHIGFLEALRRMKVGDSVLIPRAGRGGQRYTAAKKLGFKIVTRLVGDKQIRIWRVE